MGQVNVNPPSGGPVVTNDGGFGAGMVIDISGQRSKSVDEVGEGWDVVVTVCDANCPIPPRSGLKLRWSFPDPALAGGDDEERLAAFRKVRDGIQKRVRSLAARLG